MDTKRLAWVIQAIGEDFPPELHRKMIVNALVWEFQRTNGNFNARAFYDACGVPAPEDESRTPV